MKTTAAHPLPFLTRNLSAGALAVAGLLLCALAGRADITNGLVGYWKLADGPGSSTAADLSGSNNVGTLTGFSDDTYTNMWTTNSDPANLWPYALLFNQGSETSDYVSIPDSTSLDTIPITKAFTLAAWVNLSASSSSGVIMCKGASGGESWWMGVASSQFRVFMRNSSGNSTQTATSSGVASTSTWYHVAGTYKPAGTPHVIIYINGIQAGNSGSATLTTIHATSVPASIGNYTNASAPFPGTIDEVRAYNRTLSDSDVYQLYTNGAGNVLASVQPYFVQQPTNSNVAQGSNLLISAVAGGLLPLSYQWYETNVVAFTGFAVAGQTNASLVISNIQNSDSYYLVVTNSYGSTNSTVVVAGVFTGPMVISQLPVPYTNLFTLFAGANPTFTFSAVSLQNDQVYYQWFTNGVAMGGATGSNLALANVNVGSFTNYCVASNLLGSITSFVWTASVVADPTAPYPQAVLAAHPIGYWRLNEGPDNGSGNQGVIANDYLGGNNGLYTNVNLGQTPGYNTTDPETSTLFGETGISFLDSDAGQIAGIDFSSPTNTSATFSVEAWVNGFSAGQKSGGGIVSKGYGNGGEQFDLDLSGSAFQFFVRDASGATHGPTSTIHTDNSWHHVVGVCDESNGVVSLYVDGVLAGSSSIPTNGGILGATGLMTIGSRMGAATGDNNLQLYGNLNDVAVYNYALSPNQVSAQYFSAGIAPKLLPAPPNAITVDAGGTLVLPTLANGNAPLTYKWLDVVNNTNVVSGVTNGTMLNATLTVSNVSAGWNGDQLQLMVSNVFGMTNVTVSLVVVSGPPQLTANVPASLVLYAGYTKTYSVAAAGTEPFLYQWYQNGAAIAQATNPAYVATAQLSVNNAYYCAVSNNFGGGSIAFSPTGTLAGVTAPTALYPLTVLSNNPVAYWRLDETGTNAYDYAGGHNGYYSTNVQQGVAGYSTLDPDYAAQFGLLAPTNSYVGELDLSGGGLPNIDFSQPSGGNAEFSLEAWVNCPAFPASGGCIVAKGYGNGGEQFLLDLGGGGGNFRFRTRDASGTAFGPTAAVGPDGKWHHLVAVCDQANGNLWLYVDGVAANAAFAPGTGVQPGRSGTAGLGDNLVSIGARTGSSTSASFNTQTMGTIDEVALYNTALSSNQVVAHYLAGHVISPGVLTLSKLVSGQLQVIWNFSGTLQSATNVTGPYNPVGGAASPYTVPVTNAQMFYRVQQQ